ncbi:hypothetical protein GCHA_4619 [Paraglaciecola chathamensis S18K6]|uniref:Uncharacterized protein n=1 Tax=Paraglaciecola chathamensis S18K6 TaxID=1127672 RepID=A0AAV3V701_9ALTE|nr:hypothetical protein GCHA_4619 [Paraglaciecola chathamensis S18K6]
MYVDILTHNIFDEAQKMTRAQMKGMLSRGWKFAAPSYLVIWLK